MQTLPQLLAGELIGVKSLKLSCGLTEVPSQVFDLADTLEILDLTGNRLTHLPDQFARLQNLRIAFFSNNDFTQFPAVLASCPRLEMIGFKACHIQAIPEGAIPVTTRWLILTDNQITALPFSIGNCTRLQKLMLAGNRLRQLPAEMAACQNLELLRIAANELTELPDWLLALPRLSWLAFSGNPGSHSVPSEEQLPQISWVKLQVERQLGEGASGIISRATWHRPDAQPPKPVAVKVFKGAITSDGLPQDEMQACLSAGTHPNLVQVLGELGQHPNHKQGLVFELIPAGSHTLGQTPSFETCTRDVYPSGTVFTLPEVLRIAEGVASAAAHLHARGILHGDLYAHNTLVEETGHPLLSDFGAATFYYRADASTAPALERIEVRAFGCLLEDLLQHLVPQDTQLHPVEPLRQLQQDCLQAAVLQRPDFATVLNRLSHLSSF